MARFASAWLLGMAVVLAACSCGKDEKSKEPAPGSPSAPPGSASAAPHASADPDPPPSALPPLPPLVEDSRWKRARSLEPMDLGHLADEKGAIGLLPGLFAKGPAHQVALEALAHAPDAELAFGTFCSWMVGAGAAERREALRVLLRILEAPVKGERLDPAGERICLRILTEWARSPGDAGDQAILASRARDRFLDRLGDGSGKISAD